MIAHAHQSMLWNADKEVILTALRRAGSKRVAVTGTETNGDRWKALLTQALPDFHVTHRPGLFQRGDPFVAVRNDFGPLVREGVVELSPVIYDGRKIHLAFQARRKKGAKAVVFFASAHFPAHTQSDLKDGRGTDRVQAYRTALKGLRRWVVNARERFPQAQFVIAADWNLDFRLQWVRDLIRDVFSGTGIRLVPLPKEGGTHGDRLIDWVVTDLKPESRRIMADLEGLDHNGVSFRYVIPAVEPASTITQAVIRQARANGVDVLSRKDWGAQHQDVYAYRRDHKPHHLLPDTPVDTVWQHITVTLDHGDLTGDFKADVRTVERIGYERFGSGISYNWVVDMTTGQVAQGMPLDAKGTHTVNNKNADTPSGEPLSYDQNAVSLAIAVLGMPSDKLSAKAEAAIVELIKAHIQVGAVRPGFDYLPHSWVAYKDCPCDSTRNRMDEIRKAVRGD